MTLQAQQQPEVKPEVALLEDLFRLIEQGRLRVPKFQRPFVWNPQQMRDLFQSIELGYPVGTLLFWEPGESQGAIVSLEKVGTLSVPKAPESKSIAYILDGHQRLSTLYCVLRLPPDFPRDGDPKNWKWWIYRNLGVIDPDSKHSYIHIKDGLPTADKMPLRSVMRTMDFLDYARTVEKAAFQSAEPGEAPLAPGTLIGRGEELANQIKSYRIATIRIMGGTVEQAVEIFSRLNSKGQPITPDQMVSALTYPRPGRNNTRANTLADDIDEILERLAHQRFGPVPRLIVFQTIVATSGQDDIQRNDWARIARAMDGRLDSSITSASTGLAKAIQFLQQSAGVPHIRLVPYSVQMILLATFFSANPTPSERALQELQRFIWITSYTGWFSGANTTDIRKALASIRKAAGESDPHIIASILASPYRARPYPTSFDLRSARLRTHLLWQLHAATPKSATGEAMDPALQLTSHETNAYRHISRSRNTRLSSDPANRILLPPNSGESMRKTLLSISPNLRDAVLASHHVPPLAYEALQAGYPDQFIRLRAEHLVAEERKFIETLGMMLPEADSGETDFDLELDLDD